MANPDNLANSLLPQVNHNPDVLSCLANLSNDEVFTPPNVANAMLDMLPHELFKSPDTKFLDPVCKSGVFLREITKRLMQGLETELPDMQKRLDHILHNQVYGIAITELTSLLSRRTLYCAKYPNCPFSISHFDNITGNIRYKNIMHTWKNGKCVYCGASQAQYDREEGLETHAYEFIHTDNPQEIFGDMKFDVIIGNPPYQLGTGGSRAQAIPVYHKFIHKAKELGPNYIAMIIPSRWFSSGFGLDDFRKEMITDKQIHTLVDFIDSTECFGTSVEIKGGVCYFLWQKNYDGKCHVYTIHGNRKSEMYRFLQGNDIDFFIRWNEGISIYIKVAKYNESTIDSIVSSQKPFGLGTAFKGHTEQKKDDIILYQNGGKAYINKNDILKNNDLINKYKVFISAGYNAGDSFPHQIINKPIIGGIDTCCTETYITIGNFDNLKEAQNLASYIKTKFFRFMVLLVKNSQHALRKVYSLVPLQDFTKPWTDAELYAKYNLTQDEIAFIESMIKPMDLPADTDSEPQNA